MRIMEVTTYIESFLRTGEAASFSQVAEKGKVSKRKQSVSSLNKAFKGEK